MNIEQIQTEIDRVQHELHGEYQRGAIRDDAKVAELQQQLSDLTQQLEVDQRLAQHNELVEESQNQVAYMMDNLEIGGMRMRDCFQNDSMESAEGAYQLVRSVVQDNMNIRDEGWIKEITELKSQNTALKNEKETLQNKYDELYEASAQQRTELNTVKAEKEDTERKRDAASAELEEYKQEVARLNSQIDDLRQEIALGASNAIKVVSESTEDAMEAYKKLKQKEQDAKPAIYDVEQIDIKGSEFKAKLAETDEPITFKWTEKGRYREVTAEVAETFRREAEEKRSHEDTAQHGDGVAQDRVTPTEEETAVNRLDEGNINGEVATKTVEERLEALERAVFSGVREAA